VSVQTLSVRKKACHFDQKKRGGGGSKNLKTTQGLKTGGVAASVKNPSQYAWGARALNRKNRRSKKQRKTMRNTQKGEKEQQSEKAEGFPPAKRARKPHESSGNRKKGI